MHASDGHWFNMRLTWIEWFNDSKPAFPKFHVDNACPRPRPMKIKLKASSLQGRDEGAVLTIDYTDQAVYVYPLLA